ncbi:MarR family transcriptional regulator [uncultured Desulfosarcina sp.]|uniref:MarR family winged helix-turn-helix transcriptional regulator n=1 Tax=uncultured Desulfosarcina sp. TaxID=218289 RepID=UPI0029C6A7AF|nr:MarR family transcriptional regulator [uncultured Desulfosarcina sp.]
MTEPDVLIHARFIFTTGRMIHDQIMRISTGACMRIAKDDRFGELSAPQMNMLIMIRVREAVSVTELAALLGVSPPSVSTMVDRLVERGLLTRVPSDQDRRKVVIRVSPEALEDIARVEEMLLGYFVELVEAVGPETTKKWCEVLEQIKQVLGKKLLSA